MGWLDFLYVTFPVSGVETWLFLPPLVAFLVSMVTSMGGVSGAFLLLPFQVSVLHFVTPSVSATNFVFNIVAIPSGVYRYLADISGHTCENLCLLTQHRLQAPASGQ
jgi:uncharacterized protein